MDRFKELVGRQSAKTPDDQALNLQAYNGLGHIPDGTGRPSSGVNSALGGPMYGGQTGLVGSRDKPYGKRIMEIMEMLKQQPDIQELVK